MEKKINILRIDWYEDLIINKSFLEDSLKEKCIKFWDFLSKEYNIEINKFKIIEKNIDFYNNIYHFFEELYNKILNEKITYKQYKKLIIIYFNNKEKIIKIKKAKKLNGKKNFDLTLMNKKNLVTLFLNDLDVNNNLDYIKKIKNIINEAKNIENLNENQIDKIYNLLNIN